MSNATGKEIIWRLYPFLVFQFIKDLAFLITVQYCFRHFKESKSNIVRRYLSSGPQSMKKMINLLTRTSTLTWLSAAHYWLKLWELVSLCEPKETHTIVNMLLCSSRCHGRPACQNLAQEWLKCALSGWISWRRSNGMRARLVVRVKRGPHHT